MAGQARGTGGTPPTASAQIDGLLAAQPAEVRDALQRLRETIAATAPEAEEAISYAAAAFRYRGRPLVSYGAAKTHCSFYVMSPGVIDAHRVEIGEFETSKGSVRFSPEKPLPTDLITTLVRARMAETDAARKGR